MFKIFKRTQLKKQTIAALQIIALLIICHTSYAEELVSAYGYYPGYVDNITPERNQKYVEIIPMVKPAPAAPGWTSKMLTPGLKKEFLDKYDEKFGRTDAERIYRHPVYDMYIYEQDTGDRVSTMINYEKENRLKKEFGEYMLRRMAEYHVDNYMKTDPVMAPVYEVKEKISRVDVKVSNDVKVKVNYSFSGNFAEVKIDNPWLDSKYVMEFNPNSIGPGTMNESKIIIGKSVTKKVYAESKYLQYDGIIALTVSRMITDRLSGSLMTSTYVHEHGTTTRESLVFAAVTWRP